MSSEKRSEGSVAERVVEGLTRLENLYRKLGNRVRTYTATVVRTIEVVLAVALLAGLLSWFYLFYLA